MKGLSHVSEDGSIEIPEHLRECLGLEPGDKLVLRVEGGKLIIEKRIEYSLDDLRGSMGRLGMDPDEAIRTAKEDRADRFWDRAE